MTGNVIDLSIAVILAGAMGLVVKGFVDYIMMPFVGHFTGGVDFAEMKVILTAGVDAIKDADGNVTTEAIAENAILYGAWINAIINLIIVGFVLFMIVKVYSKAKKKEEEAPKPAPEPTKEELLLTEIRDLLAKK